MDDVGDRSQREDVHQRCYKIEASELVQLNRHEHHRSRKQTPVFRVQANDNVGPTSTSTSTMTMDASGDLKSVQHHHTISSGQVQGQSAQPEKAATAAKWTLADDQSMFDILLFAKESGDVAPSGHFKSQTWQDVVDVVAMSTTIGGRKDVENCKSRLQRVELNSN